MVSTPIIPATQEAEIGISQLARPYFKASQAWWSFTLVIPATRGVEIEGWKSKVTLANVVQDPI
jgi:hypothetical protein